MPRRYGEWTPNGLCSLFVCDIASFGHRSRTDLDRRKIRTALYEGLRASFDDTGVPYDGCYREDRGDGAMVVVPPSVDTALLLTSVTGRLRAEVRQHNDVSVEPARMRLRLAVHIGVARSDAEGLVGTDVNHAFRILEAPHLKEILRMTGAEVALIASERVHTDVIRHGLGLVNPAEYHRIELRVKETVTTAWITVPGLAAPVRPVPAAPPTITDAGVIVSAVPTAPDPPQLPPPPAAVTIAERSPALDDVVDRALSVRQLRSRHLRDQIVAELPLALARVITPRRSDDDRTDMTAILRTCEEHPNGLTDLLRVVRQFAGDSIQVDDLRKSIAELGRT
ncbi:effector-associated domain 2-containing protein [Actinoallomurus sp. CA-142502]|uniref:effector-associated domain 2-containing protein n=1 Tax=Actinoallomurus sp. CA-142502 TaxID=3239885 RepID=UPI003D94DF60